MFERIDLVKSVKRTKKWWSALAPYDRQFICMGGTEPKGLSE